LQQLKLSSSWSETKEKIKEADPRITDDVLDYKVGEEEQLIARLQPFFKTRDSQYIKDWIEAISSNTVKSG
jgi:hypothetical protein